MSRGLPVQDDPRALLVSSARTQRAQFAKQRQRSKSPRERRHYERAEGLLGEIGWVDTFPTKATVINSRVHDFYREYFDRRVVLKVFMLQITA